MSADIISFEDWRQTGNSQDAIARWAKRLQSEIVASTKRPAGVIFIAENGEGPGVRLKKDRA